MIAKVIAHGPTRREAAGKLARSLQSTEIHGLITNRDFLVATLRTPEFLAGTPPRTSSTGQLAAPPRRSPSGADRSRHSRGVEGQARRRAKARVLRSLPSGWRNSTMPWQRLAFDCGGDALRIEYQRQRDGGFHMRVDEEEVRVRAYACGEGFVDAALDGRRLQFQVHRHAADWFVQTEAGGLILTEQPRYPVADEGEQGGGLTAPMPGAVLSTAVTAGDSVSKASCC